MPSGETKQQGGRTMSNENGDWIIASAVQIIFVVVMLASRLALEHWYSVRMAKAAMGREQNTIYSRYQRIRLMLSAFGCALFVCLLGVAIGLLRGGDP